MADKEIRCAKNDNPLRADIPFTYEEKLRCKKYMKATGKKLGPWVMSVLLAEMDAAEKTRNRRSA